MTITVHTTLFREKLRLWRTLFIHRWHAPQTIGELHGRPSVGMRFEHINHRESLTQYVWRYGAFRENDAGDRDARICRISLPGKTDCKPLSRSWKARRRECCLTPLGMQFSCMATPACRTIRTGCRTGCGDMLDSWMNWPLDIPPFRFLPKNCADCTAGCSPFIARCVTSRRRKRRLMQKEKYPCWRRSVPLTARHSNYGAGKDPVFFVGEPVAALREAFSRNIYNALCWARTGGIIEVMPSAREAQGTASTAIIGNQRRWFLVSDEAMISTLNSLKEAEFPPPGSYPGRVSRRRYRP